MTLHSAIFAELIRIACAGVTPGSAIPFTAIPIAAIHIDPLSINANMAVR